MSRSPLITVYGQSKTGKTTFATSGNNTFLLDLEDGAFAVNNAQVYSVNNWDDLVKGLEEAEKTKPDVIALDSLTVAHDMALQHISKNPSGINLSVVKAGPTLQQFGQANELIKQLILRLKEFSCPVVCTAQERVQYIDTAGADLGATSTTKESVIDLPNGARSFVVMYSDVLGYTHIAQDDNDKPQYRLWLQPTPGLVTGMRSHSAAKLPYLPNPTISRLYRYMGLTTNNNTTNQGE